MPVVLSSTTDSGLAAVKTEVPAGLNLNDGLPSEDGNFISLMNSNDQHGFTGLGGYGYASGFGFGPSEMGIGFGGRGSWSCPVMENVLVNGGTSGCHPWQLDCDHVEGGGLQAGFTADTENYFGSWPDLVMSAPAGKGLN
jgi:hypothetical protein